MRPLIALLSLFIFLAFPLAANKSDMPPDPEHIVRHSCVAMQVTVVFEDANKHPVREENTYEAHATALYNDQRADWNKLISVRHKMEDSVKDCMDWYLMVRRARGSIPAPAPRPIRSPSK